MSNIRQYWIISVSVIVVAAIVLSVPNVSFMYKLFSTINASVSTFFMFTYRTRPFSLHKMANLFVLFFFVIANAIQYSTITNVTAFSMTISAEDIGDYERFQILVLVILLLFNLLYPFFRVSPPEKIAESRVFFNNVRLVMIAVFSLSCTLFYYRNAVLLLFFRGLTSSDDGGELTDMGGGNVGLLLFDKVIRALSFACFILAAHYKAEKKVRMLLLLIMFITLFPTALARNATAMYWLPVAFLLFNFIKRENVFVLTMLFGLLVIFPLLENFRYWNGDFTVGLSFEFLNEMHFDASQNFMIVLKHDIVTWGRQLLGALLFWLPRSLWETKPIGSGAFVAEEYNCDFTNISMPWFAEGYINFGYVGIFIFTILLSWFCSFFDQKYWDNQNKNKRITPYYLLFVSSLLFFLRGDLMSSLAYTLATLFDIYVVYKICSISSMTEKSIK